MTETGFITELDRYLFGNGTHYEIYNKLGAHPHTLDGKKGMYFAVWAPHAREVSLVCDRNLWVPGENPMTPLADSGIWEIFMADMGLNEFYKFAITTVTDKILYKADPYAFQGEYRPGTASVTADIGRYRWKDSKWMQNQRSRKQQDAPLSIYEVHIGSWKKKTSSDHDGFYTYKEAAHELAAYVGEMGYTHVELMGIAEYPYDGSWGYQVTGYYAPTSRYGTPVDFMYLVDYLHQKGIGVILDWVPAHFPRDAHGLADFDGEALYEYPDPRKGEHPDWGTKVFNYEKNEVKNFLLANALFWVEQFHIDGLRVDAVASMLYLDYGKTDGNWVPNVYGGHENLEVIEFFKHLNSIMSQRNPGAMMIAEESTAWPGVTKTPEEDGLGFSFKWNMGWMHDFLEYMKLDPFFRKFNHNKLTFGLTYFTSENFILVLSHDEVVHLKCSMINKMPGKDKDKFANLKCGYAFMFGHPGKKLLFMGQDFGQLHEWSEETALDWHLTGEKEHHRLQSFVKDLLHLYKACPALYQLDNHWEGFSWINANDSERSIFAFVRHDREQKQNLLFIINFSPVAISGYQVGLPAKCSCKLLLTQDGIPAKPKSFRTKKADCDGYPNALSYPLPAYGIAVFQFSLPQNNPKIKEV